MLLNLPVIGCGLSSHLRPAVSSAEGGTEKKDPSHEPSAINALASQMVQDGCVWEVVHQAFITTFL